MEKGEVWSLIKNIKPKCSAGFDNVATKVMVNGAQARGFMMPSGLPPMVLAQVW